MGSERIVDVGCFNVIVHGRDAMYIANTNDHYVGQALCRYGEYAEHEFHLLQALTNSGACVVEVGANIGAHTVRLAKRIGLGGRILAIEPQPPLFQSLCGTMALNGLMNIDCYPYILGNETGHSMIPAIDYRQENNFGGINLETAVEQGTLVPCQRLDDIYKWPKLDLLKIDVEGMELDVLRGAQQVISTLKPAIYLENDCKDRSPALLQWLFDADYRMWWHLPPLFNAENYFGETENIYGNAVSMNMLALPSHIDATLNLRAVSGVDDFPSVGSPH